MSDYRIDYLSLNYRNHSMSLAWQTPHIINNYWNFPRGNTNRMYWSHSKLSSLPPRAMQQIRSTEKSPVQNKHKQWNIIGVLGLRKSGPNMAKACWPRQFKQRIKFIKYPHLNRAKTKNPRPGLTVQDFSIFPLFMFWEQTIFLATNLLFSPCPSLYFLRMCFCFCQLPMWGTPASPVGVVNSLWLGYFIVKYFKRILYMERRTLSLREIDWPSFKILKRALKDGIIVCSA